MTRGAKKRHRTERIVSRLSRTGANPLRILGKSPSPAPAQVGTAHPRLQSIFQEMFAAVQALQPSAQVLIANCSHFTPSCSVQFASYGLEKLKGQSLSFAQGPLADFKRSNQALQVISAKNLKASDPALAIVNEGEVALFAILINGEPGALMIYWQNADDGPIRSEHLGTLKLLVDLASRAADSLDLSLDVEAKQAHVATLNSELVETRNFHRQFLDSLRQCYWVLDIDDGIVVTASENFEKIWGLPTEALDEDLTGFAMNIIREDRDRVLNEFYQHLGREFQSEFRVNIPSGATRWIWLRVFPTQESWTSDPASASERTRKIILIADDITERKSFAEQSLDREAEVVAATRTHAIVELANGVANEIAVPLSILFAQSNEALRALRAQPVSSPREVARAVEALEKIQLSSERISSIVNTLQSMHHRHDAQTFERVSLVKLFEDLRTLYTRKFSSAGITVTFADLPQDLIVEIKPGAVLDLLLSLLMNSLDAIRGEAEKWVKVECREEHDSVHIMVTDSGKGIPGHIRDKIFDPFFTSKAHGRGSGLGLPMAASIATQHRGSLRLDFRHPNTRFILHLPKKQ